MTRTSSTEPALSIRRTGRPLVSIMIPCLNEEESLTHVIPDLLETLAADQQFDYELVFIDDFSDDRTPQILAQLCNTHANIKAIRLGRNCGSHLAYRAGLDYCSGEAVAFTVADLQEGPELIRQSLQLWQSGAQVVGTIAVGRDRGSLFNELGARVFYWLRSKLDRGVNASASRAALRVIDRKVVEHCRQFSPRTHNINTWIFGQPFTVQFLDYVPTPRKYGKSRWTLRKKLKLVFDTLLDASPVFLTCWLVIGGLLSAGGGLTLAIAAAKMIWGSGESAGTLVATLLSVGIACTGLVLMASGVLGVYLWRIYEELRGGPGYAALPLSENTVVYESVVANKTDATQRKAA